MSVSVGDFVSKPFIHSGTGTPERSITPSLQYSVRISVSEYV